MANSGSRHVALTGGTGFLGGALASALAARGDRLTVFTRNPEGKQGRVPEGTRVVRWDPAGEPLPDGALDDVDAMVHLAGESVAAYWTAAKRRAIRDSRIETTRRLTEGWLQAARPPRVLLSGSAVGFYGDAGDHELTEDAPGGQGFLPDVAAAWEATAAPVARAGARVVWLRTGLPLHTDGGLLAQMLPPFRLGLGGRLGSGAQWMPWIHLQDWTRLTLWALDTERAAGPLNLTAPQPVTNADFTRTLAGRLGRPAFLHAPAFLLRLALRDQADEMLLASQRVLPRAALDAGFTFGFPELGPALDDLLAT